MRLNNHGARHFHKKQGFSLLEISIALTVIAFLIYGLVNKIKVDRDYNKNMGNKELMQVAKESILTFVQINGYMPCPDISIPPDGLEDRGMVCNGVTGRLPYQDLGVPAVDTWQNPLYYAVVTNANSNADVTDASLPASFFNPTQIFDFNTAHLASSGAVSANGTLRVCGENNMDCDNTTFNTAASRSQMVELAAVAVVVSFGENGQQVWNAIDNGLVANVDPRERENADFDRYYWRGQGSYIEGDEFDDLVTWITAFDIKYFALKAGIGIAE